METTETWGVSNTKTPTELDTTETTETWGVWVSINHYLLNQKNRNGESLTVQVFSDRGMPATPILLRPVDGQTHRQ